MLRHLVFPQELKIQGAVNPSKLRKCGELKHVSDGKTTSSVTIKWTGRNKTILIQRPCELITADPEGFT